MKVYNSLGREKMDFVPMEEGKVKMYVCGPTVYDSAHLGHGRSAVSFDVIRRYFLYKGLEVKFVSNYTDIDDKMIVRAAEKGVSVAELADLVIPEYERDYGKLKVMRPDVQPKATDYIAEMIALVSGLEKKGFVYVIEGDGVYFEIEKYKAYGELSGQKLEDLQAGSRVVVKEEKRSPYDFVLWKFKKEGEPFWASPWGDGRPGWHIECSAMTWKELGEKFDIHGGGLDLTFPHHECEMAQSRGVFGADSFAKYWLHNGFITVDNEKMSKSLGNFFTLKDIFEKYDPLVVRFMFLQTHYRNPINFSDAILDQAKAGLARIHDFVRNLQLAGKGADEGDDFSVDLYRERFEEFMDNDFDTSGVFGVLFDLVKEVNIAIVDGKLGKIGILKVEEFLKNVDQVLAVIFPDQEVVEADVEALIEEREEARKNRDFARSDEIRAELKERGIVLEDSTNGTIWKRI